MKRVLGYFVGGGEELVAPGECLTLSGPGKVRRVGGREGWLVVEANQKWEGWSVVFKNITKQKQSAKVLWVMVEVKEVDETVN